MNFASSVLKGEARALGFIKQTLKDTAATYLPKGSDVRSSHIGRAAAIETLTVSVFTIPTERLESDGTLEWDSTTLVLVELEADGRQGIGYTYAAACVPLVRNVLAPVVLGSTSGA